MSARRTPRGRGAGPQPLASPGAWPCWHGPLWPAACHRRRRSPLSSAADARPASQWLLPGVARHCGGGRRAMVGAERVGRVPEQSSFLLAAAIRLSPALHRNVHAGLPSPGYRSYEEPSLVARDRPPRAQHTSPPTKTEVRRPVLRVFAARGGSLTPEMKRRLPARIYRRTLPAGTPSACTYGGPSALYCATGSALAVSTLRLAWTATPRWLWRPVRWPASSSF